MKGNRFYSTPYDARNDPKMKLLRMKTGGIVAFGRWHALLGILYDEDATVDLSDETMHRVIEDELELKGPKLDDFIQELVAVGWIDRTAWESLRKIHSPSVYEQLHYRERQSTNGAKGGRGKKAVRDAEDDRKSGAESDRKSGAESDP